MHQVLLTFGGLINLDAHAVGAESLFPDANILYVRTAWTVQLTTALPSSSTRPACQLFCLDC